LASRELYLNNQRNGVSEFFYPNGVVKSDLKYSKGKKQGFGREYNSEGLLTCIIEYSNGKEVERELINQFNDSLKIGMWKAFYPNGKIKKEEYFELGILHGLVKSYDLSGELISAYRYENGVLKDTSVRVENEIDIIETFYESKDENGEFLKKESGGFVKGVPIGVHRTYDSLGRVNSSRLYDRNGNLIAEGIVNQEGDKLGDWFYYYASKKIKSKGSYRNNKRIGPWKYYYENGNIEQEGLFKRGVPDGLWKWYFEKGTLKREEYYRLGMENGESTEYDEFGLVVAHGNYLEGNKEGKWEYNFYFHTEVGNYKENYKEGRWNYFYKDNQLYFEGNFSQGKADGKHLYYHKNGKLKEVQYYNFGRKVKNWEYYDYYGSLIKILTFENDKLTKIDGVSVEID
jgi:antitoxin component YwqK of YwqJK toxin-antitoxin module